ncbi:MAG TPA: DMT family transporter [Lautropia sp.]|nr:DMT family transporter [Lautropia sp.]
MNRADPAAPIRTQMGSAEWATLIGLSVLWGGSFFFIEVAVRSIPPFTLVLMRVSLAAAALLLFLRMRGSPARIQGSVYLSFAIMGLLNNAVPFSLLAWGQTQIGGGLASIMNATTPIWGVIVAHLFTSDERITPLKLAGVLAGFAGVATMIGPELLAGIGKDLLAQCACLAAGLCYAAAGVYGRRFRRLGIDPVQVSAGQLAAAALILLPVALLLDQPWRIAPPPIEAWGSLLALALLSTTFAYVLYFRLIARAGATNALLVTFLVPVTAILLGVLLLGEALEPQHLAGMALIGTGLAAIDGRPFSRRRAKTLPH